ncbi:MAG: ribonuclease H-like domain-containing protein, partial [Caldilineaceae bacterium]|nr:ribonuclease H-like domain-containing protein [Caldilineaceae bacterium]
SCRLINLEQHILGLTRSGDDVPGHLIPQIYVDYMRTGNAAEINRVFYHNHEDIVTMVGLAEALTRVLGSAPEELREQALDGDDWAALGIAYETRGEMDQAEHAYGHALETLTAPASRADVYRRLGALQKRQQRWDEAIATWQQWLSSVPDGDPTPYVELAKYCEWQSKDYAQAAMWTGWTLHTVQTLPPRQRSAALIAELE